MAGWTFTQQTGVPGHCDCAQVWDENGKSLAIIEPTADEADATKIAAMMASAPDLVAELSAAIGYMRNAKIDLETGATKATAIRTIEGGIKRAEEALGKAGAR